MASHADLLTQLGAAPPMENTSHMPGPPGDPTTADAPRGDLLPASSDDADRSQLDESTGADTDESAPNSPAHATRNGLQPKSDASSSIHPSLVHQADQAKQRRLSKDAAPAPSSSPPKRDSFRHSFVTVDHPLAAPHHRPSTLVSATIREQHDDEDDAQQEAIIRANAAKREASLPHIIRTALATATDEKGRETASLAVPGSAASASVSPPVAVSASVPMPPSPQPVPGSTGAAVPPTAISMSRLIKLMAFFIHFYSKSPSTYRASAKSMAIQQRITALARIDYHVSTITNDSSRTAAASNPSGRGSDAADATFEYCSSYPLELLIFENERSGPFGVGDAAPSSDGQTTPNSNSHTLQSRINDSAVLKPLFRLSRFSRVHGRFVIPVILVHNKNICRSSTLAIQAEAIFNNLHSAAASTIRSFWDTLSGLGGGATTGASAPASASANANGSSDGAVVPSSSSSGPASVVQVGLEGQRAHDIQLLIHCGTSYIEDLMVEHKKKKLGVSLTSSEKNEQWRYAQMKLNALPYPGCEFFAEYKMNQHCGMNLLFNWSQSFVSSDLLLSNPSPMIPDEMLSCNGPISSSASTRRTAAQLEAECAAWYEFEHDASHHHALHDRGQQEPATDVSADALTVTSPSPAHADHQSTSPPVVSAVADDLLDQLLSHSASAVSTEAMATTLTPRNDTIAVGATSSSADTTTAAAIADATSTPIGTAQTAGATQGTAASPSNAATSVLPNTTAVSAASPQTITSFSLYRSWDIITLTKNYLLILLAHVADDAPNTGVLVHCISGWDRTPLFISLLRLSLWADGKAHRTLNALQILYFTIGYDWMLFGHLLHNRLEKGEDVFYFCFDFLQYITHSKFSLQTAVEMRHRKRIVEEELHIERSATPTPVARSPEPPVRKRTSALTSALAQAHANGTAMPPLRKSSSDGSGAVDGSHFGRRDGSSSATVLGPDDDERASLLVEGPGSFSPSQAAELHSVAPASTSYTAAKPMPSLSSFIIESHTSDQQAKTGTSLGASIAPTLGSTSVSADPPTTSLSPTEDETRNLPAYVPSTSTSAIPIPKRKKSRSGSPQPAGRGASTDAAGASGSTSTTPITGRHSFTPRDGSLVDPSTSSQVGASSHMSRVNSWTMIADNALQLNATTATPPRPSVSPTDAPATQNAGTSTTAAASTLSPPPANGRLQVPNARPPAGASSTPSVPSSPSLSPSQSSFSTLSDSAAAAASVRRCERLLEVRSLFMTAFHHTIPSTPPAMNSPHARHTTHAHNVRTAARRNSATAKVHEPPVITEYQAQAHAHAHAHAASPPPAVARAPSLAIGGAPVAAPVAKAASTGWFSNA